MKKQILLVLLAAMCFHYTSAQVQSNPVSNVTNAATNEAEAHIVVNPSDSNQMAVGFMSQSTTLGFKVYYSTDAGNSWNQSTFDAPQLSNPLFPNAIIAGGGDIILAYDKAGKLYVSWIYLYYKTAVDSAFFSGMWASSTNGGQSFQFENINQSDEFFGRGVLTNGLSNIANVYEGVCDRQWMAVDHSSGSNANNLYIGYINYTNSFGGLRVRTKNPSNTFFNSQVTAAAGSYQLSNLGVDNSGVLHYSFAQVDGTNGIYHMSSTDGGATFSAPHLVSTTQNSFPTSHPINERVNAAPSLAIDGQDKLHISWTSYPTNQPPVAFHSYSTDGGLTWSTPFNLSDELNLGTFFANVCAAGNRVSVSTYGIDANEKADYYTFVSYDNGVNFSSPVKLTSQQSDFAAFATTSFPGDYTSSTRTACRTFSVWPDLRAGGQPKLFLSSYSDCAPLDIQELTTINSPFQLTSVYPNPAFNKIKLVIRSEKQWELTTAIYSIDGKLLLTKQQTLQNGTQEITLDIASLAQGNYTLVLSDRSGNKITRLFSK